MVLSDLTSEYMYVVRTLEPCKEYFDLCNEILNNYQISIFNAVNSYFKHPTLGDAQKNDLAKQLSSTYADSYNKITVLITLSFPFYEAQNKLRSYEFKNQTLAKFVSVFLKNSDSMMQVTNQIIRSQLPGLRSQGLMAEMISSLQSLCNSYSMLLEFYYHFNYIDETLMEDIPSEIALDSEYNDLEIRSLQKNISLVDYSKSISYLSSFLTQLELLCSSETTTCRIYLRKLESGSLKIVLGSNTIELTCIQDIVRALSDAIRSFRMTSVEKDALKEQTRTLKLDNDAKELAIINSQINTIHSILGLSQENPDDKEKIQKLCLPLVRYINNNPVGQVDDYSYDLVSELSLLEDMYFNKSESTLPVDSAQSD